MKTTIKFLAVMLMCLTAIVCSGAIDVSHLIDLPAWIQPEHGLSLAVITVTPAALNESARKYRKDILAAIILGLDKSTAHMTVRPGITYEETVGELDASFELKPFTGAGATENNGTIKGRTLKTYRGQVYDYFNLKALISTIYGMDMTAKKKSDSFDINQKILMLIANQVSGKLNLHLFNAVRDDAGNATEDLFNGFDTITAADIVSGNVSVVKKNLYELSAAITDSNAVDLLKAIYNNATDELQGIPSKMVLSRTLYNYYNEDYKTTTGAIPYNTEFKKTFLEGSDNMCELVPLIGKKDSPYIHLTTKGNMLIGTDQLSDMETVRVKEDNNVNLTQFILEMFFGAQFETVMKEKLLVAKLFTT